MKITYENFAISLVKYVPELKNFYKEHKEYHGKILPHIFLGDIFWHVSKNVKEFNIKCIIRLLNFLDNAIISPDSRVQDLVGVSFLEYLINPQDDDSLIMLRSLLPPNLKKELKNMEDWKPSFSQSSIKKSKIKNKSKY